MPGDPVDGVKPCIVGGVALDVTVKLPGLVAEPFAVTTVTGPVVAPDGTTAEMVESLLTVKLADTPLNLTDVAPVRLWPPIPTLEPTGPLDGEKPLTAGAVAVTVKLDDDITVPTGVTTVIDPLVALVGTRVLICVSDATEKSALVPLKRTAVAPVNPLPVIETYVPDAPLDGLKPLMVGGATLAELEPPELVPPELVLPELVVVTVKVRELVTDPFGVVTVTGPLAAPFGTCVVTCVSEVTVKSALMPLKLTPVAPVKPFPITCTTAPGEPLDGVNPSIVGAVATTVTVKLPALVTAPFAVTTVIGPLVAPVGTLLTSCVSETTLKSAFVPLKRTAVAPVKPLPTT